MEERKGSRDVPPEAPEKSFGPQEYLRGLTIDDEATCWLQRKQKESFSVPRSFRVRVTVRVRVIQMSSFP